MNKTLPLEGVGRSLRPVDRIFDIENPARELIDYGTELLASVTSARVDVETLLAHALGCPRAELYMKETSVDSKKRKVFERFLSERAKGRPLQYILGSVSFMGCELKVREGVFIPRPETELLVEAALKLLKDSHLSNPLLLDIGTGCGNISIALTIYNLRCRIIATDISEIAIARAETNAERLGVLERIDFEVADLFPTGASFGEVDMIISNPPYIPTRELNGLPREVRFEPTLSIDGKKDGVFYHKRIIQQAPRFLRGGGWLLLELGYDEASFLKEEIVRTIGMRYVDLIRDYNGLPRIIVARRD